MHLPNASWIPDFRTISKLLKILNYKFIVEILNYKFIVEILNYKFIVEILKPFINWWNFEIISKLFKFCNNKLIETNELKENLWNLSTVNAKVAKILKQWINFETVNKLLKF